MPKLAIYVPKAEMKLVEKWRKRLNFSRIFMQALHAEIERQQAKRKGHRSPSAADDVVRAAEFYQAQLNEPSETLEQLGKRVAREQILSCAVQVDIVQKLVEMCDQDALSAEDMTLIKRQIEKTFVAADKRLHGTGNKPLADAFATAYVQGIAEAWQEISEQFEA